MKAVITFSDSITEASSVELTIFQALGLACELAEKKHQSWLTIELYKNGQKVDKLTNKHAEEK